MLEQRAGNLSFAILAMVQFGVDVSEWDGVVKVPQIP